MSRFLRRKKTDEETKGTEETESAEAEEVEATEEAVDALEAEEESADEEVPVVRGDTIPYHSEIQERLMYMFNDSTMGAGIEGTDEFYIEFMAMGERFWIGKAPLGKIELKTGAMTDQDAHVRIANDVASDLLSASNFSEFSKIYIKYYKSAEAGKFVKIEVRKPITDLNRRGYARVPIMKLLIGSAR
ncbi:hypothetical protein E4H12_04550 [Candidatus Thorarchaeota archaeon]|nr:MAG: hypothetical protein E4H12_04550 [Candidatus Thorarchaeota archaeon]